MRDIVAQGKVEVAKIDTEENPAGLLTKVLPREKFGYFLELIQVKKPPDKLGVRE